MWNILDFKQVKLLSQLRNSEKAICHIVGGRGKKPELVIDGNTSNFLMHLRRHHLAIWYSELIEAQEIEGLIKYCNSYLYCNIL